jgi:hypothetical protein
MPDEIPGDERNELPLAAVVIFAQNRDSTQRVYTVSNEKNKHGGRLFL